MKKALIHVCALKWLIGADKKPWIIHTLLEKETEHERRMNVSKNICRFETCLHTRYHFSFATSENKCCSSKFHVLCFLFCYFSSDWINNFFNFFSVRFLEMNVVLATVYKNKKSVADSRFCVTAQKKTLSSEVLFPIWWGSSEQQREQKHLRRKLLRKNRYSSKSQQNLRLRLTILQQKANITQHF